MNLEEKVNYLLEEKKKEDNINEKTYANIVTTQSNNQLFTSKDTSDKGHVGEDDDDDEIKDARKTIGISPITYGHISHFAAKKHNLYNVSNNELFTSPLYSDARKEAANLLFTYDLLFKDNEIEILETKMAFDPYTEIMWITTRESNIKNIFQRAAQVKRQNVRLKRARSKDPSLKTQIRLGKKDIELYTKYKDEPFWRRTPLSKYGDPNSNVVYTPPKSRDPSPPQSPVDTAQSGKRKDVSPVIPSDAAKKNRMTADDYWNNCDVEH